MKRNKRNETIIGSVTPIRLLAWTAALTLATAPLLARDHGHSGHHGDRDRDGAFTQTNLVSDVAGAALIQDTNLVNAWGISFSSSSPFWISDNGTGLSTLYAVTNDATGVHVTKQGLEVTIPGEGNVTGQLFNGGGSFNGDVFIFASEDGTISGWRPALGTAAEILARRTNAVYKGITLSSNASGPLLLVANFGEKKLDAYAFGTNLHLVGQFSDAHAPNSYGPFNVQTIAGIVFVTFAKQKPGTVDDLSGPGHGLVDIFNPRTGKFTRFASGSDAGGRLRDFNSPWGLAVSPKTFGKHGDQLLVGNFGGGTIMAFEANGEFKGLLEGTDDQPIVIEGLWGLTFGNGGRAGRPSTLYFTAGPADESHGLFGGLDPVPKHHGDDGDDDDDDDDHGGRH